MNRIFDPIPITEAHYKVTVKKRDEGKYFWIADPVEEMGVEEFESDRLWSARHHAKKGWETFAKTNNINRWEYVK